MNKHSFEWHGRKYYLLGADTNGTKYYLEEAHFDCDWYWGIGYVETFTNNRNPVWSRDIRSHEHFNRKFFHKGTSSFDAYKKEFPNNPYTDTELWKILELMQTAYTMREYSDTLHIGGAHYTSNSCAEIIKNDAEYDRINKVIIPALMSELYKIMEKE